MKYHRLASSLLLVLVAVIFPINAVSAAERGQLVSYSNLFAEGISSSIIDGYLVASGLEELTPVRYDVAVCRIKYWTLNAVSQDLVIASGALQIPLENGTILASAMPLIAFSHGTQSYRWYVPSCPHNSSTGPYSPYLLLNLETAEAFPYSSAGYCVFSPDYAGLGFDTDSIITPYLIAEREPNAVIDGIRAVRQMASQIGLNLNGRLFLAGYSQGGHVCLATHKMMEAQYTDEFRLTASAPGGAPADLSGTVDTMLLNHSSGGATFISFAIAAYQAYYHLWHSFEEVFLPAYTNVPDLFYGASQTMSYISSVLPGNARDLLTGNVIHQATNSVCLFAKTIASNNVYQWRPNCPMTFFYAGSDTTVPPSNSITAYNAMRALGADVNLVNVGQSLDHSSGFPDTQKGTLSFFDQYRYTVSIVSPADFDGDGLADPAVYDAYGGTWRAKLSSMNYAEAGVSGFGNINYSSLAADYDGDAKTDLILNDGINGLWQISLSASNYVSISITGFGASNWPALTADFDGDRRADPAYYERSSNAAWIVRCSASGYVSSNLWPAFGGPTCIPLAPDFDGDLKADPAVYDTVNGDWQAKLSSRGYQIVSLPGFGGAEYMPLPADYDGDGKADPAIYNETNGIWLFLPSGLNYAVILALGQTFGGTGYTALAADFDGDRKADPAIFQPSSATMSIKLSASGYTPTEIVF